MNRRSAKHAHKPSTPSHNWRKVRDAIENTGLQRAVRYLRAQIAERKRLLPIDHALCMGIHKKLFEKSPQYKSVAGKYRRCSVEITDTKHLPPPPELIPQLMLEFNRAVEEYEKLLSMTPRDDVRMPEYIAYGAAFIHHKLMWIHPFENGNGRVARAISAAFIEKHSWPFVNIDVLTKNEDRYIAALKSADSDNYQPLFKLIYEEMSACVTTEFASLMTAGVKVSKIPPILRKVLKSRT